MRYQLPPLPAVQAFEASARHESFAAAARELFLSQAAVSHRVRQLELTLGYKLFYRKPRKLALTELGKAYLPSVRKTLDDLSVSTTGLFGPIGSKVPSLTVRAPISFATLWLAPRLELFCDAYPGIDIRMKTSIWTGGLEEEPADIEVRNGHGAWDGYFAERLMQDVAIPMCSPSTLRKEGAVSNVEDFNNSKLVHILSLEDLWQRLIRSNGMEGEVQMNGIIVDSTVAALELASSSLRYTIAPLQLAKSYIETGRLVVAHPVQLELESANYLLIPAKQKSMKPETLLFRDWLLQVSRK